MNFIALEGCTAVRSKRNILENLSYDFNAGELIYITGSNGVGKSVLFDLMSGVLKPHKGNITYHIKTDEIFYMTQNISLPYLLKVEEALHYIICLNRGSFDKKDIAQSLSDSVRPIFEKTRNQRISHCSVGEAKLLLLDVALHLLQKKLFILDEPTSGLSPEMRDHFAQLLDTKMNNEISFVISTHILEDIRNKQAKTLVLESNSLREKQGQ